MNVHASLQKAYTSKNLDNSDEDGIRYINDNDMIYLLKKRITKTLESYGWLLVDSGYFSTVYSNRKKNYVLKVNLRTDPGYDKYVRFIKSHRSRYFPVISDKKLLTTVDNQKVYVYLIEKLNSYFITHEVPDTIYDIIEILNLDYKNLNNWKRKHSEFMKKYPGLIQLVINLNKQKGVRLDLQRSSNVMHRRDGTPVITDPYANYYGQ